MPGVTKENINQKDFSESLPVVFLKKYPQTESPQWVGTAQLAKHRELAPYDDETCLELLPRHSPRISGLVLALVL